MTRRTRKHAITQTPDDTAKIKDTVHTKTERGSGRKSETGERGSGREGERERESETERGRQRERESERGRISAGGRTVISG